MAVQSTHVPSGLALFLCNLCQDAALWAHACAGVIRESRLSQQK
jgi:hypothetical protein